MQIIVNTILSKHMNIRFKCSFLQLLVWHTDYRWVFAQDTQIHYSTLQSDSIRHKLHHFRCNSRDFRQKHRKHFECFHMLSGAWDFLRWATCDPVRLPLFVQMPVRTTNTSNQHLPKCCGMGDMGAACTFCIQSPVIMSRWPKSYPGKRPQTVC